MTPPRRSRPPGSHAPPRPRPHGAGAGRREIFRAPWIPAVVAALAVAGCKPQGPVRATHVLDAAGRRPLTAPLALPEVLDVDLAAPSGGGRARLVGARLPGHARPGEVVAGELLFLVEHALAAGAPQVFVHAAAPGAEVNQGGADHAPPAPASTWQAGDLVHDRFTLRIPEGIGVDALVVYAGLYEGKARWATAPKQDGDRVEIGRVHIDGAPPLVVHAAVHRRTGEIVVDGKLDEPDWQQAAVLGPFVAWDGKSPITRPTTAKLLWDADNLYLAFRGEDPDVFTPYTHDDDPLYDSEAVEIFIDADGDKDVYVELQAAPKNDLHFDAAFAGGRRKNMDRGYHAGYVTKTVVDDTGFTSEWRIPVKDLKDIPAGEPRAGATWHVNLFRLERVREGGRVVKNEASAWSTPLSGDFHNLDRFGTITFD